MMTFSVVDVETTGLSPFHNDRVVEIAIVHVRPGQGIVGEFSTLVNPDRDVGPTRIHGITAAEVLHAPRFAGIAEHVASRLRQSVAMVGHCVAFDTRFLQAEFQRLGVTMPNYTTIDTRTLAGGGTLTRCCIEKGIEFDGEAHTALHDARAAARLFEQFVLADPSLLANYQPLAPLAWPPISVGACEPCPRGCQPAFAVVPSTYLQRLLERQTVGVTFPYTTRDMVEYSSLLHRVLEDRRIEDAEASALQDLATSCGLSADQTECAHVAYLSVLARNAWADGHVSEGELRELQLVSQLLGFGRLSELQFRCLAAIATKEVAGDANTPEELWAGRSVCFTGDGQCTLGGVPISRGRAEALARAKGMQVRTSVTKKLDLLVAADPNSQSTKMTTARRYGIRVVDERVFWRTLGIDLDS